MHGPNLWSETERSYRILELDQGASSHEVERAWRRLTDEWAPTRFRTDPVLHARAELRVKSLNVAREHLHRHLGTNGNAVSENWSRFRPRAGPRGYSRLLRWVGPALVATAAVAILIARTPFGKTAMDASALPESPSQAKAPVPGVTDREMVLVASAPVTVSVSLVADGRILLPATALQPGQTTIVPRLGPSYVKYSAGESLEVEINGRRYAMPDIGPNRAKIN
jgi:hypothetical protein